jgi:formate-dependent nitrite reductase cytochrome c552 subunit
MQRLETARARLFPGLKILPDGYGFTARHQKVTTHFFTITQSKDIFRHSLKIKMFGLLRAMKKI